MLTSFIKIQKDINVAPLMQALDCNPDLWKELTARQTTPGSPHHDTESIVLRWARSQSIEAVFTDIEAIDYPAYEKLPEARELVESLSTYLQARELGRVMIVSLKPGGWIEPHYDAGAYADHYERFHVSLKSDLGNKFFVEHEPEQGEFVHMKEGEAWWFNHKKVHYVLNQSASPRIHLILDCVATKYRRERE